jgi:uncharacterized protein
MARTHSGLVLDLRQVKGGEARLCARSAEIDLPLEGEVTFPGTVQAVVSVEEVTGGTRLRVETCTLAAAECCRCLEAFELPLSARLDLICSGKAGGEDEEILTVDPRHPVVNLGPQVREALLLNLPMKLLCRTDCGGLCPGCGANLNVEQCRCNTGG